MFTTTHLFYMLNTGIVCALLLVGLFFLKNRSVSKFFVGSLALATLILHYIVEFRDFLYSTTATVTLSAAMVMPIYPCHICMWLLILSAMLLDKKGPLATVIKDMTFWAGTICGAIGTIFNTDFINKFFKLFIISSIETFIYPQKINLIFCAITNDLFHILCCFFFQSIHERWS